MHGTVLTTTVLTAALHAAAQCPVEVLASQVHAAAVTKA
jgi:hypothetical protein